LFITRTVASLKFGSGRSARATIRIVVKGCAVSAQVSEDIPRHSSNARAARVTTANGRLVLGRVGTALETIMGPPRAAARAVIVGALLAIAAPAGALPPASGSKCRSDWVNNEGAMACFIQGEEDLRNGVAHPHHAFLDHTGPR
jgi:hypothetical protein